MLVAGVWVALNATKPFHVDDPQFLMWARTIHPLPHERPVTQLNFGRYDESLAAATEHYAPGWAVLLSQVRRWTGDTEISLHWLQWPFAVMFLVGAAMLGARFGASPGWVMALCAASPLFLLPTASVMADMPCLGPGILGLAMWGEGAGPGRLACA